MNKLKITPHLQGTLSKLCGVLSVINCTRLVIHPAILKPHLYNRCIKALVRYKGSCDFIGRGTEPEDLECLLKNIICKEYPIRYSKPFYKRSNVFLDEYWQTIKTFLDGRNTAVIILFETSSFGHYTVVYKADFQKFFLFDSAHTKNLLRGKYTTRRLSTTRTRLITPETTFFLQHHNK
jgi:hypothetical protein